MWNLIAIMLIIVVIGGLIMYYIPLQLWIAAYSSGAKISWIDLLKMRVRRIQPTTIVNALITATTAGLQDVKVDDLVDHQLAGGNVSLVVNAMVTSYKAGLSLTFKDAARIDLAGRNVFEAVKNSVSPKVIATPEFKALPQDGIQILVKAKVTIKTKLNELIGRAGEDTVISKVTEGIISAIGNTPTHQKVLEDPFLIGEATLKMDLGRDTQYEILSIDLVELNVGKNVGVEIQLEKANADKNIAQAAAEKRRAMAIALEQEMKAEAEKARAVVIQSEAEIPAAISEAFRNGKMSVMEYYQYKNLKADTEMREAISNSTQPHIVVEEKIFEEHGKDEEK